MKTSLLLTLFLAFSGIGSTLAQYPFPPLTGKYAIQEKRILLKNDELTPIRLIPLLIYYPTTLPIDPADPNKLADYAPLPLLKSYGIDQLLEGMKKRSYIHSTIDLSSPFPVIFFSPGLAIPSDFYTALLEEVASHGFVIVAFSHPYMSGNVYNPEDNSVIPMIDLPSDHHELVSILQQLIELNLRDFSFVKKYFASTLNFDHFWVMGHSGGGMSATLYCDQNPSPCTGAINLDGGDYTGIGVEVTGAWPNSRKLPYLKLRSQSFPNLDHIPSSIIGSKQFLIDIKGIDHSTFTDKAFFLGMIPQGNFELIDPVIAHRMIVDHILDFFLRSI